MKKKRHFSKKPVTLMEPVTLKSAFLIPIGYKKLQVTGYRLILNNIGK